MLRSRFAPSLGYTCDTLLTSPALSADHALYVPAGTDHYFAPTGASLTILSVQFLDASSAPWTPKTYTGPNHCHG
jgi:hypothetical protein